MSIEFIKTGVAIIAEHTAAHQQEVTKAGEQFSKGQQSLAEARGLMDRVIGLLVDAQLYIEAAGNTAKDSYDNHIVPARNSAEAIGIKDSNNEQLRTIGNALGAIIAVSNDTITQCNSQSDLLTPQAVKSAIPPAMYMFGATNATDIHIGLSDATAVSITNIDTNITVLTTAASNLHL
jgi:hypothetical protein